MRCFSLGGIVRLKLMKEKDRSEKLPTALLHLFFLNDYF